MPGHSRLPEACINGRVRGLAESLADFPMVLHAEEGLRDYNIEAEKDDAD